MSFLSEYLNVLKKMDANILVAVIAGVVALATASLTYYLARRKDRETEWIKMKINHYQNFIQMFSRMAVSVYPTDEDINEIEKSARSFADESNMISLVASIPVVNALQTFRVFVDNAADLERKVYVKEHNRLWTILIESMRTDIGLSNKGLTDDNLILYGKQNYTHLRPQSPPP